MKKLEGFESVERKNARFANRLLHLNAKERSSVLSCLYKKYQLHFSRLIAQMLKARNAKRREARRVRKLHALVTSATS